MLIEDLDTPVNSLFDDNDSRRTARIEAALRAAEACRPTRCPRCGSGEVCPMFDPDMLGWYCADCGRPFVERD